MASFVGGIVAISLAAIMIANVLMPAVHDANQTGWSSSETAMWAVTGIAAAIGLVYGTLNMFGIV